MARTIKFQSTLPVRGATLTEDQRFNGAVTISIHAPREGSDGSDVPPWLVKLLFQSTLPVRGATKGISGEKGGKIFQSTLPVRGATTPPTTKTTTPRKFQSTLPVRGATPARRIFSTAGCDFNPRSP